jgi:hypothetical protein
MKVSIIALVFLLSAAFAFGQTVTITGQKKVYTRPKPIADFKKTFTVRRPIAKAATPSLSKKITAAIDPVSILEINIQEDVSDYQWLSEVDFEEVFNNQGVLTMMLWMEGSGAYPSGTTRYAVVDIAKGERLVPASAFIDLPGLIAAVRKKQEAEIEKAIKDIKADPDYPKDEDPKSLFEETTLEAKDLENFAVDMTGVAFFYEYGFPHVMKALEPEGELRLSWAEIKPFIKKDGLLARFVR